ncbi:MAG: glycosyltransferase family 39 protein [Candidatus Hydrogenedentes bacterium]|nr:glycosyltransferase family 39 protein [Candidatus Hydrogenedentota bacterium]
MHAEREWLGAACRGVGRALSAVGTRGRRFVAAGVLAAALVYVAALGIRSVLYEGAFSPDSLVYVDTARNLAAGRGISNSVVSLDAAVYEGAPIPRPMINWGPLYPAAIAGTSLLGVPVTAAALLVPVVFLGVALAGAYLLGRQMLDEVAGLVAVAILLHFAPLRHVGVHAWSETLGLAFVLLALYLAAARAGTGARRRMRALGAGLAAGLAYAARPALAPLLPMCLLLVVERRRLRPTVERLALCLAGYAAVTGPVVLRTLLLTGHLQGHRSPRPMVPFRQAASDLARVLADVAVPASWTARAACLAGVLSVLIACAALVRRRRLVPAVRDALAGGRRFALTLWPAGYLAFLVYCEMHYPIDPIDARLTVVATAVLAILAAVAAVRLLNASAPLTGLLCALSLVIAGGAAAGEALAARTALNPRLPRPYDYGRKLAHSETLAWLADHASGRDLIVCENGLDLTIYLGVVDTLFFSCAEPWKPPVAFDDFMVYLGNHAGGYERVFVVFRESPAGRAERYAPPGSFAAAFLGDEAAAHPAIAVAARLDDGVVFEVTP